MVYNIVLVRVNEWLPSNFCELQKNCIRNYKFKTSPTVNSTCFMPTFKYILLSWLVVYFQTELSHQNLQRAML